MMRHLCLHFNEKKIKRKRKDMVIKPGEWVEGLPKWSSPKEPADKREPTTPPPLCDMTHEKCRFYYDGLLKGKCTPWVDQRFGQIAVDEYFRIFKKNPRTNTHRTVKVAWTEMEAWLRE